MESKENARLYFAYGRNMHVGIMAERCPAAKQAGLASLPGHRILINTRGVSTVLPDADHIVHGVLWWVTPQCEITLDRIEGVANGHYTRETIIPHGDAGPAGEALMYRATGAEIGLPKAGYLEALCEAAAHHRFPSTYLGHLESLARLPADMETGR